MPRARHPRGISPKIKPEGRAFTRKSSPTPVVPGGGRMVNQKIERCIMSVFIFSGEDKDGGLKAHNAKRELHGSKPLKINQKLMEEAEEWAKQVR